MKLNTGHSQWPSSKCSVRSLSNHKTMAEHHYFSA